MATPRTLFDKLWAAHLVRPETPAMPAVLYVDLHLVHEVTSPQGFDMLRERSLGVRRPGRTLATLDHSTPTLPPDEQGRLPYITPEAERQVGQLCENCEEFGIELHDFGSAHRGIVHVTRHAAGF